MTIQAISAGDVNRITLGQVITDVRAVLKELVENALDADASSVEVLLEDYGIERISVADNGHGIDPEDFEGLCLRSHTLKISLLADLLLLSTLGFRGEALHSLCTVAREVKVTTVKDQQLHELTYDNFGRLANRTTKPTRQAPGTTVVVSGLFHNLPVRLKHLKKLALSELRKAVIFLNNYVIINPHTKFTVSHTNNGKKLLVVLSRGGPTQTVLTALLSVFGKNGAKGLSEVDIKAGEVTITGYISNFSFGCGARLAADRQFLYVNRRPVANKRLVKVINEVYHQFNNAQHPVFVLDLSIPQDIVDVNLTPDKTKVMINHENDLLEDVREALRQFYDRQGGITIPRGEFADTLMSFDSRDQVPTSEVDTLDILNKLGLFVDSETPSSPTKSSPLKSSQPIARSSSPTNTSKPREREKIMSSSPPRDYRRAPIIVEAVTRETLARSKTNTPNDDKAIDTPLFGHIEDGKLIYSNVIGIEPTTHEEKALVSEAESPVDEASHLDNDSDDIDDDLDEDDEKKEEEEEEEEAVQFTNQTGIFETNKTAFENLTQTTKVRTVKFGNMIDEVNDIYSSSRGFASENEEIAKNDVELISDDAADDDEDAQKCVSKVKQVVEDEDSKFLKGVDWAPLDHRLIVSDISRLSPDQRRLMDLFDLPLAICERKVCGFLNEMRNTRSRDEWIGFKHLACSFYARKKGFKEYDERMDVPWELSMPDSDDSDAEYYYNGFTRKYVRTDYREPMIDDPSEEEDTATYLDKRDTPFERLCSTHSIKSLMTPPPAVESPEKTNECEDNGNDSGTDFLSKLLGESQHPVAKASQEPIANDMEETHLCDHSDHNSDSQKSLSDFIHQPNGEHLVEDNYGKNFHPVYTHDIEVRIGDHVHWEPTPERRRPRSSPAQKKRLSTVGWLFGKSDWETKANGATLQSSTPEAHDVGEQDTSVLSLYIVAKSDFEEMQVIGQFNLGFILVRSKDDNMFIIDQHASNEKYNFELLSNKYHAPSQLLVLPLTVQLTAVDEILVKEKIHIFKLNGFGVKFDADQPPGQRVKLTLMPLLKQDNQLYTVDDFYELLALISENPHNKSVRPLKVRRQLAMKACRLSIMIGASLTRSRMEEVVKSLATLDKPWNCPHGRPTMRHLVELARWKSNNFPDYALEL